MQYITTSNLYWNKLELGNLKDMYFTKNEVEKFSKFDNLLLTLV